MDDHGPAAATAAAAAGKNATTSASSSAVPSTASSSLLLLAVVNSATTLVCACLTVFCVLGALTLAGYRRRRTHLLTDRLADAASTFWSFESDVERLLRSVTSRQSHSVVPSERLTRGPSSG